MAISRENPIALQVVATPLDEKIVTKELDTLDAMIEDADEAQSGWIAKQVQLEKLRLGHREPRNVPWPDCSNVSVPVIDGIIRRARPGFVSLILDAKPIATLDAQEATDIDAAREIEPFLTWLFTKRMKVVKEATLLVDYLLARGHAYTHEGWFYETEKTVRVVHVDAIFGDLGQFLQQAELQAAQEGREFNPGDAVVEKLEQEYDMRRDVDGVTLFDAAQRILGGQKFVRVFFRRVRADRPDWRAIDPIHVIKPLDQRAEEADFFTVVHQIGRDRLQRMAQDGVLASGPVQELLAKMDSGSDDALAGFGNLKAMSARDEIRRIRDSKAAVEKTGMRESKPVATIYQTYCFLDIDGDGAAERCVYWSAPDHAIRLAIYEYVFPFDAWPITTYTYSSDLPREVDQRGIPEMVATFQKLVNAYHNAWVDATTIQLAPMLKVRSVDGEANNIRWRPGGIIPVTGSPDDVVPMQHDLQILGELLRAENVNQSHAENYVGIFDASIRNVTQRSERRTATEVSTIQNLSDSIFGLDSKLFQESFSRSLDKVLKLWVEFGPPEVFFRVENREFPLKITRSELDRDFDVSAAGTPSNTQRAILMRNIETILPIILSPQVAGSGLVDIAGLLREYFRLVEFPLAEKIVRPTEEATVIQQVLQASASLNSAAGGPAQPSGIA